MRPVKSLSRMQGVSMVEVMVTLVIGIVVVGAVLVSLMSSGKAGRQQAAYAEMNENAQVASGIISRDLLLAGYARPTGLGAGVSTFTRTFSGRAVFACDNGFTSPNSQAAVSCASSGGAPALEVVYEADTTNTVPTAAGVPSDCLGNGLTAEAGGHYLAYNRYYVSTGATGRPELHCASRLGNAGQPLVDNVERMKIWLGEANGADPRSIVRYVTPGNVTDWGLVVSVRLCLQMRSSEAVLDSGETGSADTDAAMLAYLDCDGVSQSSADRFLRRAYFTTTTLRNKMAF